MSSSTSSEPGGRYPPQPAISRSPPTSTKCWRRLRRFSARAQCSKKLSHGRRRRDRRSHWLRRTPHQFDRFPLLLRTHMLVPPAYDEFVQAFFLHRDPEFLPRRETRTSRRRARHAMPGALPEPPSVTYGVPNHETRRKTSQKVDR